MRYLCNQIHTLLVDSLVIGQRFQIYDPSVKVKYQKGTTRFQNSVDLDEERRNIEVVHGGGTRYEIDGSVGDK